jgi:tyrosine-protein phosphatase YwqE
MVYIGSGIDRAPRGGKGNALPELDMIDIHSHILPGLDDGPRTWEEALEMARLAVTDGIRTMVASPHLFPRKTVAPGKINNKDKVLTHLAQFREKLRAAEIDLEIIPGCDIPLSLESLQLLEEGQVLTINDAKHYLLLELPHTSFPPAIDEIVFRLQSKGLTPIITHPERHFIFQEMPAKLARLLDLGCLAQLTGHSLLGGFGRDIAGFARTLVKKGYVQVVASDAHDTQNRPPLLGAAVRALADLVGEKRAGAMARDIPAKIVKGEPCR